MADCESELQRKLLLRLLKCLRAAQTQKSGDQPSTIDKQHELEASQPVRPHGQPATPLGKSHKTNALNAPLWKSLRKGWGSMFTRIFENQRGLLFINGRFTRLLKPGDVALATKSRTIEIVEADSVFAPKNGSVDVFLKDPDLTAELQVFDIPEGQRGLLFKHGRFEKMLSPGKHAYLGKCFSIVWVNMDDRFAPAGHDIDIFTHDPAIAKLLLPIEVKDGEFALVFKNGKFIRSFKSGKYAYLGKGFTYEIARIEAEFSPKSAPLDVFLSYPELAEELQVFEIYETQRGFLFKSGLFVKMLPPGRHAFLGRTFSVEQYEMETELKKYSSDIYLKDPKLAEILHIYVISEGERGVLYKNRLFEKYLKPGKHAYLGKSWTCKNVDIDKEFIPESSETDIYLRDEVFSSEVQVFEVEDDCLGALYKEGLFVGTLRPGRHIFFGRSRSVSSMPAGKAFDTGGRSLDVFLKDPVLSKELKVFSVNDNERGFLFNNGVFQNMLEPGRHAFLGNGFTCSKVNTDSVFSPKEYNLDVYLADQALADEMQPLEVPDETVALHYRNNRFADALPSGRYAFWKLKDQHDFKMIDIREPLISDDIPYYIFELMSDNLYKLEEVKDYQKGRLYYNDRFIRLLDEGTYYFWNNGVSVRVELVDTRLTQLQIQGQEILTLDKVQLRINCVCRFKITDYVKIGTEILNFEEQIHSIVQLALRDSVGRARLDELLENKDQISDFIFLRLKEKEPELFVQFYDAGVKDIILPGEIRQMMNSVLIAEKQAQSNVITRREEVASTRSLLNTAKMMEENQTLMRLKEMEYREKLLKTVCEKIGNVNISGGEDLLDKIAAVFKQA
ncbi:MAG: hypothetical protein LBU32_05925 [Clostridiales bacterium]|nr:hypothetical protein [Clostridiales bacterium]